MSRHTDDYVRHINRQLDGVTETNLKLHAAIAKAQQQLSDTAVILSLHEINDSPKCMKMQLQAALGMVQKIKDELN